MTKYDFKKIEGNWKEKWFEDNIYRAEDFSDKPKKYVLAEFPYPSGKSMHVGHMMRYTLPEIFSRYLRMRGYNVMFPMGWDAFGLPAENYAIKTGNHPSKQVDELKVFYKKSMQDMGYAIDWDREVNSTDPEYFKWTQWIFLKFYEAGLAELREEPVWWSEKMKTVLAEEEVVKDADGNLVAERDGSSVERKMVRQWVLKIPAYADKLIDGLRGDIKDLDGKKITEIEFPESIIAAQTNWIGRKEGININYPVVGVEGVDITCFTTRPDTNFGATFVVLAPEHQFVQDIISKKIEVDEKTYKAVAAYVKKATNKTDLERMAETKKKTGVFTGFKVLNRVNDTELPVYVSDFVLGHFGTGAVVGVPGHDMRDFEFAKAFDIPILRVVVGVDGDESEITKPEQVQEEEGHMVNSGFLDGLEIMAAKEKISEYYIEKGWAEKKVTYSLRDWLFSRQRYWGEPIPLIHKENGGIEAIADTTDASSVDKNLPLNLPEVPDYTPSDDGTSPLARNEEWVNTVDSEGKPAKRETNTMPNWAGSCWYYLRYIDPHNEKAIADMDKMTYWLPVDYYFGGSEHTTLHLLYSRFWHKFLYDNGVVPTSEPYAWRMNGGTLLGPDGYRMSKSRGNVIEPQEVLEKYGTDAVRMYITFIGPYNGTFPYNESSLQRCYKLIQDIYKLREKVQEGADDLGLRRVIHKAIKRTTEMAEEFKMNTMVSEFMIAVREMKKAEAIPVEVWKDFLKIVAPFAVFTAEELWQEINSFTEWKAENSVHLQAWPGYDKELIKEQTISIPVQVNGKTRGTVEVDAGASQEEVQAKILADARLSTYVSKENVKKFIYVPGKIANVILS
ncbi:MAG: leucine--tRNA ligase [Candidatus Dojkabacteria bacterium]|nr:MAG: leucine--tRNA ligase [Candidatus Dojkabacteria bacterium]